MIGHCLYLDCEKWKTHLNDLKIFNSEWVSYFKPGGNAVYPCCIHCWTSLQHSYFHLSPFNKGSDPAIGRWGVGAVCITQLECNPSSSNVWRKGYQPPTKRHRLPCITAELPTEEAGRGYLLTLSQSALIEQLDESQHIEIRELTEDCRRRLLGTCLCNEANTSSLHYSQWKIPSKPEFMTLVSLKNLNHFLKDQSYPSIIMQPKNPAQPCDQLFYNGQGTPLLQSPRGTLSPVFSHQCTIYL